MRQIDLHEAKRHLGDLLDTALGGEEVVITQDDQPVLKLVRVAAPGRRRKAGGAKGLVTMASDFDAPLEDFRACLHRAKNAIDTQCCVLSVCFDSKKLRFALRDTLAKNAIGPQEEAQRWTSSLTTPTGFTPMRV